jgi:ParB-like chromosome segregation protein Spo0J
MKLKEIKPNPDNPRYINEENFSKLKKSIKGFERMMELRPMVIDESNTVLGGNMRLRALEELGYKDIPDEWVKRAEDLTEEQKREFIIKDNVGFGSWDWDTLANEWDSEELNDWGLNTPDADQRKESNSVYSTKIESPTYTPTKTKPIIEELFDDEKTNNLKEEIQNADISSKDKKFLLKAAERHCVFNYENIAEYYAHSEKKVQELMERSALVIIDFNDAIENGFVKLTDELKQAFEVDYE